MPRAQESGSIRRMILSIASIVFLQCVEPPSHDHKNATTTVEQVSRQRLLVLHSVPSRHDAAIDTNLFLLGALHASHKAFRFSSFSATETQQSN